MTTWNANPWMIAWQLGLAPLHAGHLVQIQHAARERAAARIEMSKSHVRIHQEDIRCLQRIEEQVAGEALVLPSLPAGPYGILVRSPLHAPAILTVDVAPGGPTERRVVLGPPGKLRVKFTATETFLVKFRLLDGNEVAYPYPEGARPAPPPEQGGDGGTGSAHDEETALWAGADGILLTGLRSTTYTVEVISPELVAKPVSVAVVEGETREVEIPVARR